MAKRKKTRAAGEPTTPLARSSESARPRVQLTSHDEPMTYIDPEDGLHKAFDKLTPEQWSRFFDRLWPSRDAKAKTPSDETPPKSRSKTPQEG